MKTWTVYILKCRDGTFYTGITTDMDQRLQRHNAGTGAKYTRSRGPSAVVWTAEGFVHSHASKIEYQIKQLSHDDKAILVEGSCPKKWQMNLLPRSKENL